MPVQEAEAIDYSRFSAKELLLMEVRTELQEEVSIDSIVQESALIDLDHAQNLAESMMGDRKQISPTTVRSRLEGGRVVYDIIDGFHRCEGKRIIEQLTGEPQTMKTIVLYGCSDEELYDLRVLAASSVKSIKFARMADWMKRSFHSTKWENQRIHELVEKEEITLSQVFNLAVFDSSGRNLRLASNEVAELKEWAEKKSKLWRRSLSTLMLEMRTVELAAPDLVQRVRTGGHGKGHKGVLTRARLEAIVTHLPGDWEAQRLLAGLAIDRNIVAQDLDFLAWCYNQAEEAADENTMTKILTEPELLLNPPKPVITEDEPVAAKVESETVFPVRSKRIKYSPRILTNESMVIKKHHVAEIVRALMKTILADKGDDLQILHLPGGEMLNLNIKSGVMKLGENYVKLTDRESELMTIFSLLEGLTISDELLSVISPNQSKVSNQEAVISLKEKMAVLSEEAARELWLGRRDNYSWLAE